MRPAAENIRRSPEYRVALSHDSYDLRGRDGLLLCRVERAKAERAIIAGVLELRTDSSGAYLAAMALSYPPAARESNEQRSPFRAARIDKPDLDEMRRMDPERYRNWRGNANAHDGTRPSDLGRGAVGSSGLDRTVHLH
jgi:hypothetical protein